MSLLITSDKVIIQNAAGATKFDSSQRLAYRTGYATSNVTMTGDNLGASRWHGLQYDNTKDFYNLYITITSCNGNAVSNLIGMRMPANKQILINQETGNNSTTIYTWPTLLSAAVAPNYIAFSQFKNYYGYRFSNITIYFKYELYTYRYTK